MVHLSNYSVVDKNTNKNNVSMCLSIELNRAKKFAFWAQSGAEAKLHARETEHYEWNFFRAVLG